MRKESKKQENKDKDFLNAMSAIEDDGSITKEILVAALEEALAKAYRKHKDIADLLVRVEIDDKGLPRVFQQRTVVEELEDDELEMTLEEACLINPEAQLGDLMEEPVNIAEFGRNAAVLAKNVLKQKVREAQKQAVYDEYIDKLDEMVNGIVQSVEERFVLVNLGKTVAMMPANQQIPGEVLREGQTIRVVITQVNKETKGAQVLVSRASEKLVKRLFEREVPEIYDGIIEIKALAREAGERTKMAVYSHNPDVDPIGSCIGPRGSRVQVVIEELKGEKIDIFEWSDNTQELIKNALAPAKILAVLPGEDKRALLVIVEDNQLSLAIGKKGKNARLAVKLTGTKIDIKTRSEIEGAGIDWKSKMIEFAAEQERERRAKEAELLLKMQEEAEQSEEVEETLEEVAEQIEEVVEVVEVEETPAEEVVETEEEEISSEPEVEEPVQKTVKPVVKERKPVTEYVSRFERLADSSKPQEKKETPKKKKYAAKEEERRLSNKILKKDKDYELRPIYSEQELEEIALNEELEEANSWIEDDIDFDEYDSYYDQD